MKRLLTLLIALAFPFIAISQNWMEDFLSPSESKKSQNFYEIQKNFNDYWSNYDIKGGYYYIDGQKHKAVGWKQYKRWEWYWETRIDRKTGNFPNVNPLKIQKEFDKKSNAKADLSNWEVMGPNSSDGGYAGIGRINCITFHPSNPDIFWIGAPSGGLWKTTDGGNTWEVLTDTLPVIGVSAIFIPNDYETSKIIYIGTGDRDAGDNYSIGVLKSTDDGLTWQETGLSFDVSDRYRVTRMLVHPSQQNIFYVATNGGIYKSSDSGENWTEVLDGAFYDMEFKHGCEDTVLYAVTMDYSGSPKLYKTDDAGANWDVIYSFPTSAYRIELDVAQSDSTILYALACNQSYGLEGIYKSEDSGESFNKVFDGSVSGNNLLNWHAGSSETRGQGWYDLTLSVSPTNENELYLGGINSWKSTDGGYNWEIINHWYGANGVPEVHADKHFMEYLDGSTFFEANDGGIYKTTDGGASWIDLTDGMVISQIYKLSVSQTVKDEVIIGLQDNGSKLTIAGNWWDVKGGDGMECLIDYTDEEVQYATYAYGQIDRTTDHWNTVDDISANIGGDNEGAWVTPYVIDPDENQTLYAGYSDVWKTTNRGNTWTKISNLNLSNKIRSMAIAPSDNQTLYIADLDYFYRTTNGGGNWSNLTANLPSTSNSITYISVDAVDPMHVWITFGGYDNIKAFESFNGGETWTDISAGLPSVPANTIIQNKFSKTQQLYAGTDMGVYFKEGSGDWTLFSNKLPVVIVTELEIYYDNTTPENSLLYASTYGRGLWKSNLSSFETAEIQVGNIEGPFYVSDDSTANMQIDFVLNETFSSNTFTAYLSDETGSFTNQIEIGTLVSDVAGTIEAEIPTGTVSGTNYKVKVVSSNPVFESPASNAFEIVLDNVAPTVTISSTETSPTVSNSFNVTVTFSKDIIGFEQTELVTTNATINSFNTTNNRVYILNISPVASGEITIDIPADVAHDSLGNWNTAATQWTITYTPTGIDELNAYGINLFPNPSEGDVTLNLGDKYNSAVISVFDASGKEVFKRSLNGNGDHKIDLNDLAKSIYVVKLNLEDKELVTKLIIK